MTRMRAGLRATEEARGDAARLLFARLAKTGADDRTAAATGVSPAAIGAIRIIAAAAVAEENDAHDFTELLVITKDWLGSDEPGQWMFEGLADRGHDAHLISAADPCAGKGGEPPSRARNAHMIEAINQDLNPAEMRGLAGSLLKLADAIDQGWEPARVRSRFHWATRAGGVARNALELAKVAVRVQERGRRRERHLPADLLGEPSWQMLLELFVQFAGGAKVSTKSLCIISGCPDTTALRQIDRLEESGLVKRSQSLEDKRVTLVELTRKGVLAVGSALQEIDS